MIYLINPNDGTVFGKGKSKFVAYEDALENAYTGLDGPPLMRRLARAWLDQALADGTLEFEED